MTQQEQHETYVPVIGHQRDGSHDDHDHRSDDERGDEVRDETYPASTYASGSVDPDAADRDDVEVVDREEALAREDQDADGTVHTHDTLNAHDTQYADDTQYGDADTRPVESDEVDAAYDNAVRENEVRDVEASHETGDRLDDADVAEDQVAAAEAREDREWKAEHATETDLEPEAAVPSDTDPEPVAETETPVAETETPAVVDSTPGSVDVTAVGAVWTDGAVDGLRERWRELQLRFIDDPRAVAGEADQLVGEALDTITNALQAQRAQLANWQNEPGDDTERLRAAVRGYRDYLDRLLGM
ncbi:hypothetical protein [Dactylosporangium matsuzakiense]|uniref:Uncharacterized protein n=1 Tax=Dactylosporangium matsuzakiense TaxID=53360 RepID=A0A9W6KWM1_9ACTN|nr:hypothetical protein [Dactylosporangium matsuzakiense]UWZ43133.1 hypothetical protein Dmats_37435 [Dactylosporangium matsuzakiense]GLL06804.1 hypothetical protein GCM10017581_085540 [Dactylosporangium matsuzakiense]